MSQRAETGIDVPAIGLGTWQAFDVDPVGPDRSQRLAVVRRFFELGGRVIDSSPMYGRAEAAVGEFVTALGRQDEAFWATKVWTRGRQAGVEQMQRSLELLRAPTIGLMQVHNLLDARVHLQTLEAWRESGRVRLVGVTHYLVSAFDDLERAMRDPRVDAVQLPYSVATREAERRLLPLAQERGLKVIVNRPFEGGELFSRARKLPLPGWAAEVGSTTFAQLMLKFIISHPAVTCVIPATSKLHHLEDNMAALRGPGLSARQREELAQLLG